VIFKIVRIIEKLSVKGRLAVAETLKNKDVVITSDIATTLHSTRGFLVVSATYLGKSI